MDVFSRGLTNDSLVHRTSVGWRGWVRRCMDAKNVRPPKRSSKKVSLAFVWEIKYIWPSDRLSEALLNSISL